IMFSPGDLFSLLAPALRPNPAATPAAEELSYSPTEMEMQSVGDNSESVARAQCWLLCRAVMHRIAGLVLTALIALPHAATAQDWSINARLLSAARTGDEAGLVRALADGAAVNARSRIRETALQIAP